MGVWELDNKVHVRVCPQRTRACVALRANAACAPLSTDLPPALRDCPDLPQAPARLSDKRQRLKEHRRVLGLGPASRNSGRDGDSGPRLRRLAESEKPNGKRQCKTKHISLRERRGASRTTEDCPAPPPKPDPSPQQTVCAHE